MMSDSENNVRIHLSMSGAEQVAKAAKKVQYEMGRLKRPIKSISDAIDDSMAKHKGWASEVMKLQGTLKSTSGRLTTFKRIIDKTAKSLVKQRQFFDMNALSVMFFGMALQRVFKSVWTRGTQTFNDVMHSVEGTTTSFDLLNGTVSYLGFVMGEALEPLAAFLVPIVMKVSELIERHQTLFRVVLAAIGVGGAVLMAYGTLKLGLGGLVNLIKSMKAGFEKFVAYVNTIDSAKFAKGVREALSSMKNSIGTFKGNMEWVKNNPIKTIIVAGAVTGIIAATMWIFKLKESMGGWGEFLKSVIRGILRVNALAYSAVAGVLNEVMRLFSQGLNWLIDKVNWVISKMNSVLGTSVNLIGHVELGGSFSDTFSDYYGAYADWEQKGWLAPEKGYLNGMPDLSDPYGSQTTVVNNYYGVDSSAVMSELERGG